MITITKPSRVLYPVRWVYFSENPAELIAARPWEVIYYKQANEAIRDHQAENAVMVRQFHTLVSDLTLPLDTLWERIHPTRRRKIRRGEEMAPAIEINQLSMPELYQHYRRFTLYKGLASPSYSSFAGIARHCHVIHLTFEGTCSLIRASLIDASSRIRGVFLFHNIHAAMPDSTRSNLNSYCIWWEMQYYKSLGIKSYDWAGVITDTASPFYGITQYKESFGGELRHEWDLILTGRMLKPLSKIITRYFI